MSDSEIFKNYIKVANVFKNSRDFVDLEFLMRLYYFTDVLDFSNDNNFFHYLRITEEGIIRKISLNVEQYKMLSDEVNRWKNSYDPNNKDYYYEKKKEFLSLLQIFKSFSEENQKKLQNGTIRQKLEALDEYLNDNSIDEQNPFYELVDYLELLEEYVAYKPIEILANNIEKLKKLKDNSNFDSNGFYKQIENIVVNDGKGNNKAASWIIDILKWCDEMYDKANLTKRKVSVSEKITNYYESGKLNEQEIEELLKASNTILEHYERIREGC